MTTSTRDYAINLARAGYPVFPCGSDKRPLVAGGYQAATADLDQIAAWWHQWPAALIGVPTGQRTGIHVLDLDVKPGKNGPEALKTMGLVAPPTRVHITQSGGYHLIYLADQLALNKTDSDVIAPGVDRRGDGGYIIWWPAHGCHVIDAHFVPAPDWMRSSERPAVLPAHPPIGLTDEQIDTLLGMIPPAQMDSRSEWIRVGMALHHEFGGDAAGLQMWDSWSQRWPKYDGLAMLEREWQSFGRGHGAHVSMRSFIPAGWMRTQGLPEPTAVFTGTPVPAATAAPVAAASQATPLPSVPLRAPALPQGMRDARDGTETTRPLTEHGNALRIYDKDGVNLRYVPETKGWLHWQDGAWVWDLDGAIPRTLALSLASDIYAEGAGNLAEADTFAKWGRKSQELRVAKASVAILSDIAALRVPMGYIDSDIMLAGLDHGRKVLDLRTGGVRAAEQGDMITKSLGVSEVGDARACHTWLRFLNQIFNYDEELIEWMQRLCGYILTGDVSEQFFCFAFGTGRNGKGTFAELVKYILGDYSRTVSPSTLAESNRAAGGASPDVAALAGARFVLSSETNDGVPLAEGFIKNITGGDTMSARQLYGMVFEFMPLFKLFMMGNHKPIIKGVDYAMWARVRLIPFVRTFGENERDPEMPRKLREEARHILAWMVEGCLRWQQKRLQDIPTAVRDATASYRNEQDTIGQWLDEKCGIDDPNRETVASMLYMSYRTWALENGHKSPLTAQSFGRRMSDRGFLMIRTTAARSWKGIYLRL